MFNKTTFGGGFGQQQQQQPTNSLFGQPQQQPQQPQPQQNTFGGFGSSTPTTTGFGAAQNTGTSAFGQPAQQTTAFGQPSTGGFGSTTSTPSAFGQQQPSAFGSSTTSAFGSNTSTGFGGGFGASTTNTTSAFGNTASQAGGGLFGQRPSTAGFGQPTTTTTTFGQPQPSAFGTTATSAFGQPAGGAAGGGQGTGSVDFAPTQDRDVTTGINNFFQSITAMPQYKQYSIEELRLQDYNQSRKTGTAQGAPATGGFGSTAAGGFGSTSTTTGGFGQSNTGGFGQQPSTTSFGQPAAGGFGAQTNNAGGGLFGQTQSTGTTGFGQQSTTTGFGQTNTGGFGANTGGFGTAGATTGFGAGANAAQKPFGFGATSQPTTGFGATAATTGGFGQNALGTTGFGQANQQAQQSGFGFGQKPAGTTTTGFGTPSTGFGATTGGFGATSKPTTSFSFNATSAAPTAAQTTGFGGGFGAATSGATTGFGATQPAQAGFGTPAAGGNLFGAKPAGQTNTLFNTTTPQAATGTTGFGGFGTNAQSTAVSTGFGANTAAGGSLFGQKPATGGLGTTGFGFGNTQQATGTTGFGFGNTQQAGAGSFTLPATGGLTSFGTNGLQPGQQPLVATVDKNPYGVNPLFDTSKLQQQGVSTTVTTSISQSGITTQIKTEPTAVPIDGKKMDTLPHYPVSPRVVSKIKLRGFSFNPTTKPNSKKTIRFNGISDDSVLGAEAFSPRSANNKLVFDQVNSNKITELVNDDQNKKNETPLTFLDPRREQLATKSFEKSPTTTSIGGSNSSGSRAIDSDNINNNNSGRNENVDAKAVEVAIENGYYCSPTLDVLKAMTKDELKKVDKFIVGRRGYGEVKFDQPVDLSELNLNEIMGGIVVFQYKTITIYPNARNKPPVGSGLNNIATVTLEGCFTVHPQTKEPIKDPNHPRSIAFIEKLRKSGDENVKHISYNNENGNWVFQAKSF